MNLKIENAEEKFVKEMRLIYKIECERMRIVAWD